MSYVDFVCIPISENNVEKYKPMIKIFTTVMKEHGLINYCEAIADDVSKGTHTDFYKAVAAENGETVIAAFMRWPSKEVRNNAWEKGMQDPRLEKMGPDSMPFDGKRMFWGGFKPLFEIF